MKKEHNKKTLPHNHGEKKIDRYVRKTLSKSNDFLILSETFKLIGDSSRLKIFWLLCHLEECVTNISALVEMSSPAVSHHLKLLKSNGLIISRREGKEVYYKVPDTPICRVLHEGIEDIMKISCPPKEQLQLHIAQMPTI